jgi:hypothetical protein
MMKPRVVTTLAVAAFVVGLAAAFGVTSASASTIMRIGGSMANGGCGPVQNVNIPGPSKIVVHVSSTAVETGPASTGPVFTRFLNSSGGILVSGPSEFNASGPGSYGVQVCSAAQPDNPAQLQYTGEISLLPPTTATTTQHHSGVRIVTKLPTRVDGHGGIRSHGSIVWITVTAKPGGPLRLSVVDPRRGVHLAASSGLHATFGSKRAEIRGDGMTLILTLRGAIGQQHLVFHSRNYSVSGKVVRGGIILT